MTDPKRGMSAVASAPRLPRRPGADIGETAFKDKIIDVAHLYDWIVAHFRPARTAHGWRTAVQADGAGFPDLVLVHRQRRLLWFRELKARRGKLSADQRAWAERLVAAGADWQTWWPTDWDDIVDALSDGKATAQ